MNILVTGSAGYIGSHTCVELLNASYNIIALDNFSNSKKDTISKIKKITNRDFRFYQIDCKNMRALEKYLRKIK